MIILILDPHGDDWLWCAGEIKKRIDSGDMIYYVRFGLSKDPAFDIISEVSNSLKEIGINNIDSYDFPIRNFCNHRQEILDILISYRNELKPDIVYTPSRSDVHQDHKVICHESIRAFSKLSSIFGYDMPWNTLDSMINRYVKLTEKELQKKIDCASYYKSQLKNNNNCTTSNFLKSLAVVRGNRINVEYAEAYEVIVLRD